MQESASASHQTLCDDLLWALLSMTSQQVYDAARKRAQGLCWATGQAHPVNELARQDRGPRFDPVVAGGLPKCEAGDDVSPLLDGQFNEALPPAQKGHLPTLLHVEDLPDTT